jgi:hypothetical protein
MAKLTYTRSNVSAPAIGVATAARAWPAVRAAAVPASIVLLALLLRVVRLELQAWTPDTYEQMTAAHRLVSGQFPLSTFYPPGVAVTLAPAFVLFPQTLATQQGVIIAASLLLIIVTYVAMRRATNDRLVPILLALGVAIAPQFVYFSRDGLFDVINTAWIVTAILIVPWLRRQSLPTFAAYGVLLAVAVSIRATNPAFLPALIIYWADIGRTGFSPRKIWRATFCRELIVAGASMVAMYVFFAWIGGSIGRAAASSPAFDRAASSIAYYAMSEFGGLFASPVIVVLAALGGSYLWARNRTLLYVSIYMLTIFPLAHVLVPFRNSRYMLPPLVFAMLLAAHAPAAVISMTERQTTAVRIGWRAILAAALLFVGAYFTASDVVLVMNWPASAAKSDEAGYRQVRPAIHAMLPGTLLVSGGTRGVRDSNDRIEYLDLIDYSLSTDNGPVRVSEVMDRIGEAIAGGRPVYYLYTRIEGLDLSLSRMGPSYQPYFDAASKRFHVTPVRDTSVKFFTLYKIEQSR